MALFSILLVACEDESVLNPNDADAYYNRGVNYMDLGQHERAIEDYTKAIQIDPDHFHSYVNRGVSYSELGQYEHAIDDLNKAIQLNPDDAVAYSNRGANYIDLGRHERAIFAPETFWSAIRCCGGPYTPG